MATKSKAKRKPSPELIPGDVRDALTRVLEYAMPDEKEHYEEASKNGSGHIYEDMLTLQKWLQGNSARTAHTSCDSMRDCLLDIKRLAEKAGDAEVDEETLLNLIAARARDAWHAKTGAALNTEPEFTNADRAQRAKEALLQYNLDNDAITNAVDFLADLQHFYHLAHAADATHPSFDDALESARFHFETEQQEAA